METIYKKYIWLAGSLALVAVAFAAFAFGLLSFHQMKNPNEQYAQITVTGEGEVNIKPDVATISFTVRENAATVPEAQKKVEAKISAALAELKALNVSERDMKTDSYTVNPKYENPVCNGFVCTPTSPKLIGYEVAQSVTVKIRATEKAGEALGLIGKTNITEISGPQFTVDDMDSLYAQAREIAIIKAQEKAELLADSLQVSLGTITAFSDNQGGGYPMPYGREMMMSSMAKMDQAVSPTLPQGETNIKVNVSITYTLR